MVINIETNKKIRVVGYARVSTKNQDLTGQVERIQKYIEENPNLVPAVEGAIFQEKMSGVSKVRAERNKIMKLVSEKKVDLIICTKLDRWGRSLKDLLDTLTYLNENNVSIKFLDQNMDFSSPVGKLILQVLGAIAEFERTLIIERTQEGRTRAMLYGTKSGKPMHAPIKELPEKDIIRRYKEGETINSLAREYKSSPLTIRKRLELRGIKIRTWKNYATKGEDSK